MKVKRKLLVQMADPAGNTTAFVLNGARHEDYAGIAGFLMEHTDCGAEQVAFVNGVDSFDMSGMEFCGNAARAFALISSMGYIDGKGTDFDDAVLVDGLGQGDALPVDPGHQRGLLETLLKGVQHVQRIGAVCEFKFLAVVDEFHDASLQNEKQPVPRQDERNARGST